MMDEQFAQYAATAVVNATAGLWPYLKHFVIHSTVSYCRQPQRRE